MVGEHEHADLGMAAADLLGGQQAVVAVVGRHADVDDRDVGPARLHHAQQGVRVAAASRDLEAGVLQQAGEALSQEHLVVGDHEAHGSSARRWWASAVNVPPTAPTRSSTRTGSVRERRRRAQLDDQPLVIVGGRPRGPPPAGASRSASPTRK